MGDLVDTVKKFFTGDEKTGAPGKHLVNGKWETPEETADRESGGGSKQDDATTASNPGKQAQSTDHMNSY